jgi:hypothetical protein
MCLVSLDTARLSTLGGCSGRVEPCASRLIHVFCLPAGLVSTYAGIALLVLLQLNSAIAPQVRPLDRF